MTRPEIRLLVAGDESFRSEVGRALSNLWAVVQAQGVADAAQALLASRPDVALLDLRGGSEGISICRRIKGAAATRMTPVLAFSAEDEMASVAALEAGADHLVRWPPRAEDLR